MSKLFKVSITKAKLRDMACSLYKRSGDPTHPENAGDADFQAGYLLGCHSPYESSEDIKSEWEGRGEPNGKNKPFRSWKAGYWAGRYTRLGK
jgi:hypothetical protein